MVELSENFNPIRQEGLMERAKVSTEYCCGVDLHARTMYVTVVNRAGEVLVRQNVPNHFGKFVRVLRPFLPSVSVGVESTYNWYWLADGCHQADISFYLGHALYMKAIHSGKKKNDRIDSQTIADLLRCGFFPVAYPYPREMRATRDLLRRRHRYVSLRAEAYTHIQGTFSQHAMLGITGTDTKRKTTRRELPGEFEEPSLSMSVTCDLDMVDTLDAIITQIKQQIRALAKHHDNRALSILMSVPGVGEMIALTILYEMHTPARFPSAQKLSSYARLVKVDHTSNGKWAGEGNPKIGNPHLKWAFTEIVQHGPRQSERLSRYYDKLKSRHRPGKARIVFAHKFAVAIYHMLKNGQAFDEKRFLS